MKKIELDHNPTKLQNYPIDKQSLRVYHVHVKTK